jgi:tetratricopeptide (TPR) repeat protein
VNRQQLDTKVKKADSNEQRVSLYDTYAEGLFEKENYSEAVEIYNKALKIAKEPNIKAYFTGRIGICHFNTGDDQKAFIYLLKSARLFEQDKPEFMRDMYGFVFFHLGSLYEYHGRNAKSLEARKVCEGYLDSQEKDTRWMLFAGISRNYEALGKHEEAIRYSQKAIQVLSDDDPGLSYLYETMASNYMGLKQYMEAIKHFSKVLELDPQFQRREEVQLKMADCYSQLSNYRMALETYEKMLDLKKITDKKKDLVWIYLKMAECQFRLQAFERSLIIALELLRSGTGSKLQKAEARSYLTSNYYELGRYKEAVEEGEKALLLAKRFPNDDLFYVRMALSYHRMGNKKSFTRYRSLFRKLFREDNWNKHLEKLA